MNKFSVALATIIQIVHEKDYVPPKKVTRFSRRSFWAYRAVAAGELWGEELSAFIEREKDPRVLRQVGFSSNITDVQLMRLAELHVLPKLGENFKAPEEDHWLSDLIYAIIWCDECTPELREKITGSKEL